MEPTAAAILAAIGATTGAGKNFTDAERAERVRAWAGTLTPGMTPAEGMQAVKDWFAWHDEQPKPANINRIVAGMRQTNRRAALPATGDAITLDEHLSRHPENRQIFERWQWTTKEGD